MARLFGTDGVRGLANRIITAELAVKLAAAAAHTVSLNGEFEGHRPTAVVGTDSRASGDFLAAAVAAGLASAGVDILQVGTLPTPGLAYLTATQEVDLGVMLSASHNPMADNGIKFFAHGGYKLPDDVEDAIEARLDEQWDRPIGAGVGRITSDAKAHLAYIDHLVATATESLDGLTIALDCANGASSAVAPEAFRRLGARVVARAVTPDGTNINDGVGSTHPDNIKAAVVAEGADLGFAFDGDADRCLAVDHTGQLVDGDQIMGILAGSLQDQGRLGGNTLVATVMSNHGLIQAMAARGITTLRTTVGDRYVLEEMRRGGYTLGGEQSGHVIMSEHATTGDGTLTAIQTACQVVASGQTLADLAAQIPRIPQKLINVGGVDRTRALSDRGVRAAVAAAEAELGQDGRVLLRPSGTEPLVRVMVEAPTSAVATAMAERLAEVVRERLAL